MEPDRRPGGSEIHDALDELMRKNARAIGGLADTLFRLASAAGEQRQTDANFDATAARPALVAMLEPVSFSHDRLLAAMADHEAPLSDVREDHQAVLVAAGRALADAIGTSVGDNASRVIRYAMVELLRRAAAPGERADQAGR